MTLIGFARSGGAAMSDYTPTTGEVREAFSEMSAWDMSADEADAAFDRWLAALIAKKQAEARRDVILHDVRKAVTMALAFVPWPRVGEEYDAGLMVDALTKEFIDAQRLREQATNQVSRGE